MLVLRQIYCVLSEWFGFLLLLLILWCYSFPVPILSFFSVFPTFSLFLFYNNCTMLNNRFFFINFVLFVLLNVLSRLPFKWPNIYRLSHNFCHLLYVELNIFSSLFFSLFLNLLSWMLFIFFFCCYICFFVAVLFFVHLFNLLLLKSIMKRKPGTEIEMNRNIGKVWENDERGQKISFEIGAIQRLIFGEEKCAAFDLFCLVFFNPFCVCVCVCQLTYS